MKGWMRFFVAVVALCGLGLAPTGAAVAQVKVTRATPASAYQGTTSLDVVVDGSGFDRTARVRYLVSGTTETGGVTVLKVLYRSSSELVTTIAVAENANLADFDIEVTLDTGRKGKGTTLFSVSSVPTYPADRAWHTFTSNREPGATTSHLYLFGGAGDSWTTVAPDLWSYSAYANGWTLVRPSTKSQPGGRQWHSFSCGNGACVLSSGSNGVGLVAETWVYSEATDGWTQATCSRRTPCPSSRQMAAMTYDAARGVHVMFGGRASTTGLNDTWTFDAATLQWRLWSPAFKPAERNRAAFVDVPGVGLVLHGGQGAYGSSARCDMHAWNGSVWRAIAFDASQPHPCLHTHSGARDGATIVFGGGYVDTRDTPNPTHWRFTFAADGLSGTWSTMSAGTCQAIAGSDAQIHPGAVMAYDAATSTRVYFGGERNTPNGVERYGNTVECR
jgi:hypothetical protein